MLPHVARTLVEPDPGHNPVGVSGEFDAQFDGMCVVDRGSRRLGGVGEQRAGHRYQPDRGTRCGSSTRTALPVRCH